MTYTIKSTHDMGLIRQLMTDKRLFEASMPDEEFLLLEAGTWSPNPDYEYVVVYKEQKPIGLIRYSRISNITVDAHHQVLSQYWGKGEIENVDTLFIQYLREFTSYKKITVRIPQSCDHTLKAAARLGYQIEGVLMDAVIWRQEITNIILMSKGV